MLTKPFVKALLAQRADYYLSVFLYLYAQSDDEGKVVVPHKLICTWFKVHRTTLMRVMQFGVDNDVCLYKVSKGNLIVTFTGTLNVQPQPQPQSPPQAKTKAKAKAAKSDTLYAPLMERYKQWILDTTQVSYVANQIDNAAAYALIKKLREGQKQKGHLHTEEDIDAAVMNSFDVLLKLWHLQPAFYQTQLKLSQINSNLVVLIQNLKASYGKTKQNRASAFARAEANINSSRSAEANSAGDNGYN